MDVFFFCHEPVREFDHRRAGDGEENIFPAFSHPVIKGGCRISGLLYCLGFVTDADTFYDVSVSLNILMLPFFIILTILSALAAGIWLSALSIRFRDFQHVTPFLVQVGLYATPIAYPGEVVIGTLSDAGVFLFYLNPMTGIAEGFRWSILGYGTLHSASFISYAMVLILFVSALIYFKKVERIMADVV